MIPGGMTLPFGSNAVGSPWADNIELWVDGADASTFSLTGSLVDQWNDKSGNGHHLLASTLAGGERRPTKSGNGVVFSTTGVAKGLVVLNSINYSFVPNGFPFSYYLVWKRVGQNNDAVIIGSAILFAYLQYASNWYVGNQIQSVPFADDTLAIKSARTNGSSELVRATNGVEHTPTVHGTGIAAVSIGSTNLEEGPLDGTIYELIVYSVRLSDAANTQTINYLKAKWGI